MRLLTRPHNPGRADTYTTTPLGSASCLVDWRASLQADRVCCGPGEPAVVVIMPPAPGRLYPADLLLCRHHSRVSAHALAAAGAGVLGSDGTPLTEHIRSLVRSGR